MKVQRVFEGLTSTAAILLLVAAGVSCRLRDGTSVPAGVQYLGKITEPTLGESSGVVMSHRYPGVFWTHNDSDNREVLYAIKRDGALIGKWRVLGSRLADWEDITFDPGGDLLLADTGDNRLWRRHVRVHRIKEPDPNKCEGTAAIEQSWILSYPKGPRNAEAIFVLGTNGYLITKSVAGPAEVYRFPLSSNANPIMLELVAKMNVGSPVKGACLSPDGRILALVSPVGAFAYRIDGDASHMEGLAPEHLTKFRNRKIEGCTFVPEGLLTVSESRHMYLFTNDAFRVLPFK